MWVSPARAWTRPRPSPAVRTGGPGPHPGVRLMRLETKDELGEAVQMYRSSGYREVSPSTTSRTPTTGSRNRSPPCNAVADRVTQYGGPERSHDGRWVRRGLRRDPPPAARVAESLIAGPQYRASGTIRLAVRPGWLHRRVPFRSRYRAPSWSGRTAVPRWRVRSARSPRLPASTSARPTASTTSSTHCRPTPSSSSTHGGRVDPPQPLRRRACHEKRSPRTASGAVARTLRRRGDRGRGQLRRLGRRRLSPDAVRVRRPVDSAHRPVLERPVRGAVPARPGRTMSTRSRPASPISSNAAEGNCDRR